MVLLQISGQKAGTMLATQSVRRMNTQCMSRCMPLLVKQRFISSESECNSVRVSRGVSGGVSGCRRGGFLDGCVGG